MVARSGPVELPAGLSLAQCVAPPSAPSTFDVGGRITLLVRMRRGRVSLVTTAESDPGVAPFAPCFERELASAAWTLRRGRIEVPITVTEEAP